MGKLIIIALFVVAAVLAWAWLRRRHVVGESQAAKPAAEKGPSVEDSQAEPATPLLTSPDVACPVTNDATASEQNSAVREPEQTQPPSVPPPDTNLSKDDVSVPSKSPEREPLVAETKTPNSVLEAAIPAGELPTQLVATDENLGELSAPPSTTTAAMSVVSPPTSGEAELVTHEGPEPPPKAPTYHPPTPPPQKPRTLGARERTLHLAQRTEADLRLRVQLVFGRGGTIKTLALVADKREGMPSDVEVRGTHGGLPLTELRDDCYQPVRLVDAGNALQQGVVWHGCSDGRRWRWVLSGRELYVLAPGAEFGLSGFVSAARLWLNARHIVLAKANLRDQVLATLTATGCATPEVSDDIAAGVPSGWILFRNVTPTRAIPMREEQDILNILCPAHEIEPHFVGGIRIERKIWLAGFPPRIRFTGELGDGFQVLIDGQTAQPASDGAFEAPGWDSSCEHRLWFGDRSVTYSLRTMDENWECWHAHDFGTGAAICGAVTHRTDGRRMHQVCVPAVNPLLLGARPDEFFCCQVRHAMRSENIIAMVPFAPVWALPMDPVHADKRYARLILLDSMEPVFPHGQANRKRNADYAFRRWITAINDTRRKQLALAVESEDAKALWRRYRVMAKQLWRKVR